MQQFAIVEVFLRFLIQWLVAEVQDFSDLVVALKNGGTFSFPQITDSAVCLKILVFC